MKTIFKYLAICALFFAAQACKPKAAVTEKKDEKGASSESQRLAVQDKFFEAMRYKAQGNEKAAYKAFEECLQIDKANAASHYELARLDRHMKNDLSSAFSHAAVSAKTDPSNPWYHQLLAEILVDQGKYLDAVKSFREVQRLNPKDQDVLFEIATAYLYADKYAEAIKVYDEIEKKFGISEETSFQKHQLYVELGQIEKAGVELIKLAEAYPDEARYWGVLAQFYQQNGLDEKAADALKNMVAADPDNGQVHYQLSEYYAMKGDDTKSYEELLLAFKTFDLTIDQKISVLLKYFQLTNVNQAFLPQAYELLAITEKMHSSEAKAYSIYGDFLYRDRRDDEALAKFKKALELDPSRSTVWNQVLNIEAGLSKTQWLFDDSKKAVELFPGQPWYYYTQGIAAQQLKKYQEAADVLSVGKELVVDDNVLLIQFYSALGTVYNELKQYQKSDESFDYALGLDPRNELVLNNYAYYLSVRKIKLEKAAEMSKLSNELSPNNAVYQDTYAWVLFQQGKFGDAKVWIEKAMTNGGQGGEIFEHYGDILFRLNDLSNAVAAWKKAKDLGGAGDNIDQKINLQRIPE